MDRDRFRCRSICFNSNGHLVRSMEGQLSSARSANRQFDEEVKTPGSCIPSPYLGGKHITNAVGRVPQDYPWIHRYPSVGHGYASGDEGPYCPVTDSEATIFTVRGPDPLFARPVRLLPKPLGRISRTIP